MLEGRRHAINFLTGYSGAFRLGPSRRHDRGDLGSDLARSRRRNLKVPCDLKRQGQRGRVVVLGDRRHEHPRLDVDGHRVQVMRDASPFERPRRAPALRSCQCRAVNQMPEERLLSVGVECYAGHRGEQTPCSLIVGDRRISVAVVLDAWLAPDYRYFKLKGADGDTYLVRHDERSNIWELTMFRAERVGG